MPGHVEAIASGPGIHRHYLRLGGDRQVADTRQVAARAAEGDERAVEALRTGARAAGMAAGSLANALDPELVIITGGMAGAGEIWWNALREGFADSAIDALRSTSGKLAVNGYTLAPLKEKLSGTLGVLKGGGIPRVRKQFM